MLLSKSGIKFGAYNSPQSLSPYDIFACFVEHFLMFENIKDA